jgi:nucleotide sugar dehydrogenase
MGEPHGRNHPRGSSTARSAEKLSERPARVVSLLGWPNQSCRPKGAVNGTCRYTGRMRIAVVGIGKIGQPLAALYASREHQVIGADSSPAVAESVRAGHATVVNEPGLEALVAEASAAGQLTATTDTAEAVAVSEVVVVAVPLLIDDAKNLDYRMLDSAFADIARGLQPGTLVLLETTVPVGDTRLRFGACLEKSGLSLGRDFWLAFSPERVQSGTIFRDLAAYPKVVGGVDDESGRRAEEFYREVLGVPVLRLGSSEAAEFCKLAESVYRDVNIGLANELAISAERLGVDIGEVIAAANSEPQSHLHQPGIGVGGHCMPVYPYFLLASGEHPIVAAGRAANEGMPAHAVRLLTERLGSLDGRTILILGLAYRPGVKEAMLSPATALAALLHEAGASALVHDPLYSDAEIRALGLHPSPISCVDADALVLQTYHREYRDLDLHAYPRCRLVLDGRNALDPDTVRAAGMGYVGIGKGAAQPD